MTQDTVKVEGLRELDRQMRALELRKSRTAIGKALRAGGGVIRKSIKGLVPKLTKLLFKSIKVTTIRHNREVFAGIIIRPPTGEPEPFYWRALEEGTGPRFHHAKRGGKATGSLRALKFMRRGFDRSADQAADKVQDKLGDEIDKLVRQTKR